MDLEMAKASENKAAAKTANKKDKKVHEMRKRSSGSGVQEGDNSSPNAGTGGEGMQNQNQQQLIAYLKPSEIRVSQEFEVWGREGAEEESPEQEAKAVQALADDIERDGQNDDIVVILEADGGHTVQMGHRRRKAGLILEKKDPSFRLRAKIRGRDGLKESDLYRQAVKSNSQRKTFTPLHLIFAAQRLLAMEGKSAAEFKDQKWVAKELGVSAATISEGLEFLGKASPKIVAQVLDGTLSMESAKLIVDETMKPSGHGAAEKVANILTASCSSCGQRTSFDLNEVTFSQEDEPCSHCEEVGTLSPIQREDVDDDIERAGSGREAEFEPDFEAQEEVAASARKIQDEQADEAAKKSMERGGRKDKAEKRAAKKKASKRVEAPAVREAVARKKGGKTEADKLFAASTKGDKGRKKLDANDVARVFAQFNKQEYGAKESLIRVLGAEVPRLVSGYIKEGEFKKLVEGALKLQAKAATAKPPAPKPSPKPAPAAKKVPSKAIAKKAPLAKKAAAGKKK